MICSIDELDPKDFTTLCKVLKTVKLPFLNCSPLDNGRKALHGKD
jgi:hypothetical protein